MLQRVIDMVQINCEHCAAIEIGNERHAAKVNPPERTPFQIASLKAKAKADKTGQMMVAVIIPKERKAYVRRLIRPRSPWQPSMRRRGWHLPDEQR